MSMPPLEIYLLKRKKMADDTIFHSIPYYNVIMQKQDYYNDFFEIG